MLQGPRIIFIMLSLPSPAATSSPISPVFIESAASSVHESSVFTSILLTSVIPMFVTVSSAVAIDSISSDVFSMCESDGFAFCFEKAIIGLRISCFAERFAWEVGLAFVTGDRDRDLM